MISTVNKSRVRRVGVFLVVKSSQLYGKLPATNIRKLKCLQWGIVC